MKRRSEKLPEKGNSKKKSTNETRAEEPYSLQGNGNISRAPPWPKPQLKNEKMFILPKVLDQNDEINIRGQTYNERRQLTVGLVTGYNSPDNSNVACQLQIYFQNPDKIAIQIIENGDVIIINDENTASDYFDADPQYFDIRFLVRSKDILDVRVGESFLDSVQLRHDVNNIRFLTVHGDVDKVSKLDFSFG